REPLDHQGQSPRSSQCTSGLKRETLVFEQLLSRIFEDSQCGSDELVGKFFDADFEQQLRSGRWGKSARLLRRRNEATRFLSLRHGLSRGSMDDEPRPWNEYVTSSLRHVPSRD